MNIFYLDKDPSIAASYRNFYIHDKSRFATFKQGVPDWYKEGLLSRQHQV